MAASTRRRPPPAPWGPFPLSELSVLGGWVAGVVGIVRWDRQGLVLVAGGLILCCLAGAELAVRHLLSARRQDRRPTGQADRAGPSPDATP